MEFAVINALLDFPKTRTRCRKPDNSSIMSILYTYYKHNGVSFKITISCMFLLLTSHYIFEGLRKSFPVYMPEEAGTETRSKVN